MKVIYLVTCRLCQKQYVGKTEQTLRQRCQISHITVCHKTISSQNNYENNWLLKLKENNLRHYGHRREIETLSSPLGRHFGEFTFLFYFFFIFIYKLQMSSQGATISGEGCGYDNWQLQIIDRVEEGQPGQLGKRLH